MSSEDMPAIAVPYNPELIPWNYIRELVKAAQEEGKDESLCRHLVGASLHLGFPGAVQDDPTVQMDGRTVALGHYLVGNMVFQVILAPYMEVYEKCREIIEAGYRVWLLVPEKYFCGTRQNAEIILPGKITVSSIESFVSQNLERLAGFSGQRLKEMLTRLIEAYNKRVLELEKHQGLLIQVPF